MAIIVGIALCAAYLAGLVALQHRTGVPYTDIATTEDNLRRAVVVPVAIGAAVLVVALAATGRLADAFGYTPRADAPVLWAIPALVVLGAAVRLRATDWTRVSRRFFGLAVVGTLLVGLSEELLVRGFLVDVLRDDGLSIFWTAVVSSAVFGVMHGANVVNGEALGMAALQVAFSVIVGLGLFASLAVSGTLVLPILLHALFDFSLLIGGTTVQRNADDRLAAAVTVATYLACLGSLLVL